MMEVRETRLRLLFSKNETDVSADIAKDLLSWSYLDKESGQADEISLQLKDETGKWAGSWRPDSGENIKMFISTGTVNKREIELYCGRFFVDYQRVSGAPRVYELKAVSVPLNMPIRKLSKTRAWETRTLSEIAGRIAEEAEMELFFDSGIDPSFQRIDQSKESDLKFLNRLCEDNGLSMKVTDRKIVIFDQQRYEEKAPVKMFVLGVSDILSYDFEASQTDSYKAVTIKWRDPKKKVRGSAAGEQMFDKHGRAVKKTSNPAVNEYTYTDPKADENGQVFELKRRATSIEEAKQLAKAKLRKLNSKGVTGSLNIVGDPTIVAGCVVAIAGFGSFDGNFIVEEASHSGSSGGYTTALRLRKVNVDY